MKRVAEIAVLDPQVLVIDAALGIFRVNSGHAVGKLEADNLESALVGEADAAAVLFEILAVDERFVALAIAADDDRFVRRAAAFGSQFLVPGVTALQQQRVAGFVFDRCLGKRFPWLRLVTTRGVVS